LLDCAGYALPKLIGLIQWRGPPYFSPRLVQWRGRRSRATASPAQCEQM